MPNLLRFLHQEIHQVLSTHPCLLDEDFRDSLFFTGLVFGGFL